MGTISYALHRNVTGTGFLVVWASLSTSSNALDAGQTFPSSVDYALGGMLFSDKSLHVFDTTTASNDAQLLIEGSNQMEQVDPDAMTYATLTDPQGNALLWTPTTTPRIEAVLENTVFIRPRITTISAAAQAVHVYLLLTSNRNARSGM